MPEYYRPFHEIARLLGFDDAAAPEPVRCNPMHLSELGMQLFRMGKSLDEVCLAMEIGARECNVKPSILCAAVRDVHYRIDGLSPVDPDSRTLVFSGRMDREGQLVAVRRSYRQEHWQP